MIHCDLRQDNKFYCYFFFIVIQTNIILIHPLPIEMFVYFMKWSKENETCNYLNFSDIISLYKKDEQWYMYFKIVHRYWLIKCIKALSERMSLSKTWTKPEKQNKETNFNAVCIDTSFRLFNSIHVQTGALQI